MKRTILFLMGLVLTLNLFSQGVLSDGGNSIEYSWGATQQASMDKSGLSVRMYNGRWLSFYQTNKRILKVDYNTLTTPSYSTIDSVYDEVIGWISAYTKLAVDTIVSGGTNGVVINSSLTVDSLAEFKGAQSTTAISSTGNIVANSGGKTIMIGATTIPSSYAGIWIGQSSPSLSNYSFLSDGIITAFNAPHASGSMNFNINNSVKLSMSTTVLYPNVNFGMSFGSTSKNILNVCAANVIKATGTVSDNDATPSMTNSSVLTYAGSSNSVIITDLDNPTVGVFYTLIGNSDTYTMTINDGGNFSLSGGVNFTMGLNDVIVLYCVADDNYIEISRSDN